MANTSTDHGLAEYRRSAHADTLYTQFYLTLPGDQIRDTLCSELGWSHLRVLMCVADPAARQWTAREGAAL